MKRKKIISLFLSLCLAANMVAFAAEDASNLEDEGQSSAAFAATTQDTTAPTISEIKVDGYEVTVSASDETALHAEAYSFNGGWTWQKSNSYVSSGSYTWVPGTICVPDEAGERK